MLCLSETNVPAQFARPQFWQANAPKLWLCLHTCVARLTCGAAV